MALPHQAIFVDHQPIDAQQPVSGDWWAWGCLTGQNPNGCVGNDGKVRPEQAPFIDQMLFRPGREF